MIILGTILMVLGLRIIYFAGEETRQTKHKRWELWQEELDNGMSDEMLIKFDQEYYLRREGKRKWQYKIKDTRPLVPVRRHK